MTEPTTRSVNKQHMMPKTLPKRNIVGPCRSLMIVGNMSADLESYDNCWEIQPKGILCNQNMESENWIYALVQYIYITASVDHFRKEASSGSIIRHCRPYMSQRRARISIETGWPSTSINNRQLSPSEILEIVMVNWQGKANSWGGRRELLMANWRLWSAT